MADGGALRNLRVIDLTDDTGRFASKLLTEAGADVLRVGRGSPGVQMRGQAGEHGGLLDWWYDGGKQRLELDLDSPAGQRQFKDLAARADLLIETEPPGRRRKTRSKRCGNSRLREYQQAKCRTCAIVRNETNNSRRGNGWSRWRTSFSAVIIWIASPPLSVTLRSGHTRQRLSSASITLRCTESCSGCPRKRSPRLSAMGFSFKEHFSLA